MILQVTPPSFFLAVYEGVLDFTSSMTGHVLSWPVAFVVAVLVFRNPVTALIGRVRSVNGAGVHVEMREKLDAAESDAVDATWKVLNDRGTSEVPPSPVPAVGQEEGDSTDQDSTEESMRSTAPEEKASPVRLPTPVWVEHWTERFYSPGFTPDQDLPSSVPGQPRRLIMWSWDALGFAIRKAYEDLFQTPATDPLKGAFGLAIAAGLPDQFADSVKRLQEVYFNAAVEKFDPTEVEAEDYRKTAEWLIRLVEDAWTRRQPPEDPS